SMQAAFDVAIIMLFGWKAFFFLLISFFFSVGLHPLGARWIQEHYLTLDEDQETYSYYGPLNTLAFNVGYHNEHHDSPTSRVRGSSGYAAPPPSSTTVCSHTGR